jgi:hypothetical protein
MCFRLNSAAPSRFNLLSSFGLIMCNGCHTLFSSTIFRARFSNHIIYVIAQAHNLFLGSYFTTSFWRANFFNLEFVKCRFVSTGTEQTNIKESSK